MVVKRQPAHRRSLECRRDQPVVIPWRPAPSRIGAFERLVAWTARARSSGSRPSTATTTCSCSPAPATSRSRPGRPRRRRRDQRRRHARNHARRGRSRRAGHRAPAVHGVPLARPRGAVELDAGAAPSDCSYVLGERRLPARDHPAHLGVARGQDERSAAGASRTRPGTWRTRRCSAPSSATTRARSTHCTTWPRRAGEQYDRNAALMERYRAAAGDAAAMAALIGEGQSVRAANASSVRASRPEPPRRRRAVCGRRSAGRARAATRRRCRRRRRVRVERDAESVPLHGGRARELVGRERQHDQGHGGADRLGHRVVAAVA